MTLQTIPITQIIEDKGLQIRDELSKTTIAEYAEALDQLPPVIVFQVERKGETRYLLADGYHRTAAHRQRGRTEIVVDVLPGEDREARTYALMANCKHGLPLTRKERQRAIEAMLKLNTERADTWIANDLGVDQKTVTTARQRLEAAGEVPELGVLLGADGIEYRRNRKDRSNGRDETQSTNTGTEIPYLAPEPPPPPPDPWADRIICADAIAWLAEDTTMYDLIVTDPPYGILDEEWEPADLLDFTRRWLTVAVRRLKPSGRLYVCFSQRYMLDLKPLVDEMEGTSLTFGGVLIWNYRNVFNKKYSPATYKPTYEPVFHWYGPEAPPLRYDTDWNEERGDVWGLAMPQSNYNDKKVHPAQKPVELLKGIIRTASQWEDYVLDPFGGSGTTAVAAQELGRRWRVIEQSPEYVELIRERLQPWVR